MFAGRFSCLYMDSSLCTLGHVQEREFWQLLEEVLGRSYGRALAHDQVLDRLGGMTAVEFVGETTLLQSLFESGARPLMAVEVLDDALHRLAPNAAAAKAGQSGAATLQAAGLQPPWWKPIPQEMSSTAPNPGTSGDIP